MIDDSLLMRLTPPKPGTAFEKPYDSMSEALGKLIDFWQAGDRFFEEDAIYTLCDVIAWPESARYRLGEWMVRYAPDMPDSIVIPLRDAFDVR